MIYLACPYTHPDPAVQMWRMQMASWAAGKLMEHGRPVYNPLAQSVASIEACESLGKPPLELDHGGWVRADLNVLTYCGEMLVLCLPGWRESFGVRMEVEEFRGLRNHDRNMPRITYLDPEMIPLLPRVITTDVEFYDSLLWQAKGTPAPSGFGLNLFEDGETHED